jgi:preprotein translocase subunit YajC
MTFSQNHINTLENLIAKNKTMSISIYLVFILAILIFLIALPYQIRYQQSESWYDSKYHR